MIVHSSKLACPVRVNLNRTNDFQAMNGLCTIVAHQGKDIASASCKCTGNLKECEGEFTIYIDRWGRWIHWHLRDNSFPNQYRL